MNTNVLLRDKKNKGDVLGTKSLWPKMTRFTLDWYRYVKPVDITNFKNIKNNEVQALISQIKLLGDKLPDNYPKYPNIALDIVQYKANPEILRLKSFEIPANLIASNEIKYFSLLLMLTLVLSENLVHLQGVGLSAIQVGAPYQMFWAYVDKLNKWELFFNPEITPRDNVIESKKEGCLSIVGVEVVVPRHKAVKIKYKNVFSTTNKLLLKGFDARVVQHEFDHLHGKLIVDY